MNTDIEELAKNTTKIVINISEELKYLREFEKEIIYLVATNPNDYFLGSKIRALVN